MFPSGLKRVRAGYLFDGPIRRATHLFKYSGEHERGRDLGRRLAGRFEALFPDARIDVIVPVPLHPRRYRQRGFNQSLILAKELGSLLNVPVVEAVERKRNTTPQAGLSADRRLQNLKDAFAPSESAMQYIAERRILVVDDVTTTGATISAVAESLQSMGVRSMNACTLAREQ